MTQEEMREIMEGQFHECMDLRAAGQKEYAHEGCDAFENFNRIAADLQMDRKQVLWVYLRKHLDGIVAFINGHQSQREDVRGRLGDAITYLCLLRGMIEDESGVVMVDCKFSQ